MQRRAFLARSGAAFLGAAGIGGRASGQGPASTTPLKVGLIGAGGRGSYLADAAIRTGDAEVVAVCDIYQPRLEKAATKLKARSYPRSAELLRDPAVQAVIIATPDRHHIPNTLEAIRAGKDVYVEKPICHWAQFDLLKQLVHENRKLKRVVQVGTQFVADPVWEAARDRIAAGAIGKPVHAQTSYFRHGDWGEAGMPVDDPNAKPGVGVDWDAFQADAPRHPFSASRMFRWRLYLDYSGGPVTDVYPHMITPLYKALNPGFPSKVVALGGKYLYDGEREVPDTFDMLVQYPKGLTVAVLGTLVNDSTVDPVIRGSEGTMFREEEKITFEPQPKAKGLKEELPNQLIGGPGHHDLLGEAHLQDFFNCVRTRKTPRGDLEIAYIVQIPVIMAMLSHLRGKVALFDADKEEIRLS